MNKNLADAMLLVRMIYESFQKEPERLILSSVNKTLRFTRFFLEEVREELPESLYREYDQLLKDTRAEYVKYKLGPLGTVLDVKVY